MSGRGSPLPDSGKMDLTPPSDERYRLPPNPPLGSDEFLYLHAETITKMIDLKAKMLADWFRPQGLDPESAGKLDQIYEANAAEMKTLCEGLGMTYGELPDDILALHEKIKTIHLRLHGETTSPQAIQQKPSPIQKGKGKRSLDAEGYQIPPKHLVCKNPAENLKIQLLYRQVTPSLSLLTPLSRAMTQPSLPLRRPANSAFRHTLFVRTRTGF
ncbi:hypothetical protein CDAR_398291 [Caerostris darwini]|uniref:Uncharacterized protein n=1 Tax=Caerostris darwini TaxID=1538125 RepID=A0AAV4WS36_9ARAC|nr:hypothetical protein CDAR_398291 [Caerostris darwini]